MLKKGTCDYTYLLNTVRDFCTERCDIEVGVLGRSILGREIPLLSLGHGKKTVMYVGAIHGTDHATAGALLNFATDYVRQYAKNATLFERRMSCLFEERRILIVPMLNPDGVEYCLHGVGTENPLKERVLAMNGGDVLTDWRANARGVDLAKNCSAGFSACKQQERELGIAGGSAAGYSGEFPESEPETAALCHLFRGIREELLGVLVLSGQGESIYCSCENKLSAKCRAVGRILQRATGYRMETPENSCMPGSPIDFCITELSRPAYTLTYKRGEQQSPHTAHAVIYEALRRALYTFPYML